MAISVSCSCGKTLSVKDELAGKRGKCPACGAVLTITQPAQLAGSITKPAGSMAKPQASGAIAAKPQAAAVKPAPAKPAPAKPAAQGGVPGLMDLPPLDSDDGLPSMGWDDIASEGHLSMAGAPQAATASQSSAATSSGGRGERPPGGYPGELICPFCNADLDTITADDVKPQMWLGALTGIWLSVAPFKCRNCGPIKYNQLIGESKKTVKKRGRETDRDFIKAVLVVVFIIALIVVIPMYVMPWWRSFRFKDLAPGSSQQEANESLERFKQAEEQRKKEREAMPNRGFPAPPSPPSGSNLPPPNYRPPINPNSQFVPKQGATPKPGQPRSPPAKSVPSVE